MCASIGLFLTCRAQISENRKISEQLKSILGELEKSGKATGESGYSAKEIGRDLDILTEVHCFVITLTR